MDHSPIFLHSSGVHDPLSPFRKEFPIMEVVEKKSLRWVSPQDGPVVGIAAGKRVSRSGLRSTVNCFAATPCASNPFWHSSCITQCVTEMNIPEMHTTKANVSSAMPLSGVNLYSSEVQAMRHGLHELANVFTGVMIAGDLLFQHLESESLQHYASHIREGNARGCALVRELRSQLLAACGELEVAPNGNLIQGNSLVPKRGPQEIHKSIS